MSYLVNTRYQVKTPSGWQNFDGIKKTSKKGLIKISFASGNHITCTPEHKFLDLNQNLVYAKDLTFGSCLVDDVVENFEFFEALEENVYDLINVENGHLYYTNCIVSSNCAFIRDFDDIWTSLYPTLSTGGSAIILSTPNGVGGQYYKLWTEAESGVNDFNPIRLPWDVHPEHNQEWFNKETRNLTKRQIAQEFLCLAEGTKIITKDGYKKIEELKPGNEVLTHKGQFKKILKTHSRKVEENESLWEVSSPGNRRNPILVTGDHPALSYRFWANGESSFSSLPKDLNPEWIPVQEIGKKRKTTDRVLNCLFPKLQTNIITDEVKKIKLTDLTVETFEETEETCRYFKQWGSNKKYIPIDYNLGKLVGLYLAEGCKSHCGGLDLGFHVNEWDSHVSWVTNYLESFGCNVKSAKTKGTNGCRVWSYNKYFGSLVRFFVKGDYAPQKTLNMELLYKTNIDFIKGVLEGHYLGDGNHHHNKKFCVYSTSVDLIYQLRTLYSLFCLYPRIGVCRRNHKNTVHHDTWYLEFYANGRSYSDLIENGQTYLKGTKVISHDDYFIGKVTIKDRSELISEGITVYDIKVEDDASFVAESLILHNCDFVSSGDTFLQPTEFEKLRGLIRPPLSKEGPQNGIWVWKNPEHGRKYVISADVSRGDSSDFSAFHVIDYETCEVCAEFMGKIPPDRFAELLSGYGKRYNQALICPEQNTFGYFTCVKLRDEGYPSLYYQQNNGDLFGYKPSDPETLPGFSTQTKTRTQILAKLEESIRNDRLKTFSQRLYDQLQAFIWNGAKAQAARDAHDDLIMSLAIGTWLTAGDNSGDSQGMALAMAMLKATSVGNRNFNDLPGGMNQVRPVPNAQIQGFTSDKVHQPRNPEDVKHVDVSDFSWLFK